MLSDRHRGLKIALLLGLLAWLSGAYGEGAVASLYGYWKAMANPVASDGRSIFLSIVRVEAVYDDHYVVTKVERQVPVIGDPTGLAPGDTVSVRGHFSAERQAVVEDVREVHHLRFLKRIESALGALLSVVYLGWVFRVRDGRVVVRA